MFLIDIPTESSNKKEFLSALKLNQPRALAGEKRNCYVCNLKRGKQAERKLLLLKNNIEQGTSANAYWVTNKLTS